MGGGSTLPQGFASPSPPDPVWGGGLGRWPTRQALVATGGCFDRQNHWVSAHYDYGRYHQEVYLTADDETDAQGRAYWERVAAAIPRKPVVARPAPRGAPEPAPAVGGAQSAAR